MTLPGALFSINIPAYIFNGAVVRRVHQSTIRYGHSLDDILG